MTDPNSAFTATDRDRLCELSGAGASRAAQAFETILGREVAAGAPRVLGAERYRTDGRWSTAVIFEADGELGGLVVFLLPVAVRDALGAQLLGIEPTPELDPAMESALRELGNIIASHTISAMADAVGGRILISVPQLVTENAPQTLDALITSLGVEACIECELQDDSGELQTLLLLVPEHKSWSF